MAKAEATVYELVSKIERGELRLTQTWCCKVRHGRWPDDILARLLALNAECYKEEVILERHSKGARSPGFASGRSIRPSQVNSPDG